MPGLNSYQQIQMLYLIRLDVRGNNPVTLSGQYSEIQSLWQYLKERPVAEQLPVMYYTLKPKLLFVSFRFETHE